MSSCPVPLSAVSEALRKHIDPTSSAPLRLMAARGMVPMGPKDLVTVLVCLTYDPDEKIGPAAEKSLAELPERIALGALKESLHPLVLDRLARILQEKENLFEAILTNQKTPDETFAYLAERVGDRLLAIITENQVRILRHPPIAKAALANPSTTKADVDRLMDFAVRTGIDFAGLEVFEEAKRRILSTPPDLQEEARIQQVIEDSLPEDMLQEEAEPRSAEEAQQQEQKHRTLLQRLHTLTPSQKVALAQKGNKTIRLALIRDANKVVATAAIKNPGVTESEAVGVATSRSVCDDVIRIICNNREWTRSYAVKLALVQNPKTPIAFSMRFLNSIRTGDLKDVATSKNIPNAVATAAKKILRQRQGDQ